MDDYGMDTVLPRVLVSGGYLWPGEKYSKTVLVAIRPWQVKVWCLGAAAENGWEGDFIEIQRVL